MVDYRCGGSPPRKGKTGALSFSPWEYGYPGLNKATIWNDKHGNFEPGTMKL